MRKYSLEEINHVSGDVVATTLPSVDIQDVISAPIPLTYFILESISECFPDSSDLNGGLQRPISWCLSPRNAILQSAAPGKHCFTNIDLYSRDIIWR